MLHIEFMEFCQNHWSLLSMRQKTKNHQNQGSIDKKFDFFPQSPTHIPRWVHLVQKTRAKKSHAWAPLKVVGNEK
jgi:hypothetical protein